MTSDIADVISLRIKSKLMFLHNLNRNTLIFKGHLWSFKNLIFREIIYQR